MNDTILALLSALAIYGLVGFAMQGSDSDPADDDSATQVEDLADLPPSGDLPDGNPPNA